MDKPISYLHLLHYDLVNRKEPCYVNRVLKGHFYKEMIGK